MRKKLSSAIAVTLPLATKTAFVIFAIAFVVLAGGNVISHFMELR
jgi:hypothetical protein